MATLQGRDIATTFKDLIRFENAGAGLPVSGDSLVQLEDGHGNTIPVRVSRTKFDIMSGWMIGGVAVTATAANLNALVAFLTTIDGTALELQLNRGDTAGIPGALKEGELWLNTDTSELSVGDDVEAVTPVKLNGSNIVGTVPAARLPSDVALRTGTLQTSLNSEQWGGHKVLVQTGVPGGGDGDDGDIAFVYTV
jgi:hypothetical protein